MVRPALGLREREKQRIIGVDALLFGVLYLQHQMPAAAIGEESPVGLGAVLLLDDGAGGVEGIWI